MALPLATGPEATETVNALLKKLRPHVPEAPSVTAEEVTATLSLIFANQLSSTKSALFLHDLTITGLEQRPDILAGCANVMRSAAVHIDATSLRTAVAARDVRINNYHGGLCDIVGTGGDHHSTFNISTASSILASALVLVAKHGNRASTSKSGSADVLARLKTPSLPKLENVTPDALPRIYEKTNYAFLFAPNFHKGMKYIAPVRKEIPHPTIFNLLGPLANPADVAIEARCIGVKKQDLVPVFAEALKLNGAKKAMVVCGDEDLDEISIAGPTHCARLEEEGGQVDIKYFSIAPEDFGLPRHPLAEVSPGKSPEENAEIMKRLVSNELAEDDPILHFVLVNVAALFVISGVCNGTKSAFADGKTVIEEVGPGGGRWKEGVRLARQAIASGRAMEMLRIFSDMTNEI
ncbi:hypothetical protein FH972_022145 [Carpinus fangiana]|uniref:Glycosyl transferase family 3 domain-containing protein n=1 Tax=Carpinus fangiana TaxID=176857 RepID=A0A5N6KTL1_9ROSI|nr:hypothetical protein FH972_022145 [Carpinus fangiana]